MLRTIRLTTAFICFTLVTLLFLDFTGTLHTWFGWLAKIQFLPAVLALNLGVVLLLIALTWIFGRHIPGCCFMACGETEEKPFPLFPRLVLVKIRSHGDIYPCHDQRVRGMGGLDRTLQRLRAYRL